MMNLEPLYDKLPGFIKYNRYVYNFTLKLLKVIKNSNSNQTESNTYLLNLLFTSYDIKVKGNLRNTQLISLELLRFIDNVCKKHNIKYWLDFGSLLGAIRHKGFIPWDDDIDLSIMREDYEKLIKVLPEEISRFETLKNNCFLIKREENNKNYFENFNKDSYNFTDLFLNLRLVWLKPFTPIDFFPLDYIPENKIDKLMADYRIDIYRLTKKVEKGDLTLKEGMAKLNSKYGITKESTGYIFKAFDNDLLDAPRYFKEEDVFPLTESEFEGYNFPVPNNLDPYLKVQFGNNYMSIPSVIDEPILYGIALDQFESEEEMDKVSKETLEYLRKINQEF